MFYNKRQWFAVVFTHLLSYWGRRWYGRFIVMYRVKLYQLVMWHMLCDGVYN